MPAVSKIEHLAILFRRSLRLLAWATRTLIVRKLKGLEDLISMQKHELRTNVS
jgi:hypothetical protein